MEGPAIPSPGTLDQIRQVPLLAQASRCTAITAGFSDAQKYVVPLDGGRYLLKIYSRQELASVTETYHALKTMEQMGIRSARAIAVGQLENPKHPYLLQTFIEGASADRALSELPDGQQYAIGEQAGRELRKMHEVSAPPGHEPWDTVMLRKYEQHRAAYRKSTCKFRRDQKVADFIEHNLHWMADRPSVFQHDDYHPANLIINNGALAGAIDFDRHDWGDPVHDFLKVALFSTEISIPFSIGQIMGYEDGGPSESFWQRYALYTAMNLFSSILWVQKATPGRNQKMTDRIHRVIGDHDGFDRLTPKWFDAYRPA